MKTFNTIPFAVVLVLTFIFSACATYKPVDGRGFYGAVEGERIDAKQDSEVIAQSGSHVRAHRGSTVVAMPGSTVEAFRGSKVLARAESRVIKHDGADVSAEAGATVEVAGSHAAPASK